MGRALRNVFDQYSQPENRVTHALLVSLDADRSLLASFLTEVAGVKGGQPARDLSLVEQTYPGAPSPSEEDADRRGIPDAWIFDADNWCVIVESKVLASVDADQIARHIRTAQRRGFERIHVLILTVRRTKASLPSGVTVVECELLPVWLTPA